MKKAAATEKLDKRAREEEIGENFLFRPPLKRSRPHDRSIDDENVNISCCSNLLALASQLLFLQQEQKSNLTLQFDSSLLYSSTCQMYPLLLVQRVFALLASADEENAKANNTGQNFALIHEQLKSSCLRTIKSALLTLIPLLSSEVVVESACKVDTVSNAIIDAFLLSMKQHPMSFSVQAEALKLLQRFLVGTNEFCALLFLLEESSTTLSNASEESRIVYFCDVQGPSIVLQAMKAFSTSTHITCMGLDMLRRCLRYSLDKKRNSKSKSTATAGDINDKKQFQSFYGNATLVLIRALSHHKHHSWIQTIGWSILATMSEEVICRKLLLLFKGQEQPGKASNNSDTSSNSPNNIVDWIISLMNLHRDNCDLQCNMTAVLCWLLHVGDGQVVIDPMGANDTTTTVHKNNVVGLDVEKHIPTVFQVMKIHLENSSSVFGNCICILCGTEATFSVANGDPDGNVFSNLSFVIEGMKEHIGSYKVQEGCLQWICLLLNRRLVHLRSSRGRVRQQRAADDDAFQTAILQKILFDCVPIILKSMESHQDISRLQSQACSVLVSLMDQTFAENAVENNFLCQHLIRLPSVDAVLRALKLHGQDNLNLQLNAAVFLTSVQSILMNISDTDNLGHTTVDSNASLTNARIVMNRRSNSAASADVTAAFGGGLHAMETLWKSFNIAVQERNDENRINNA